MKFILGKKVGMSQIFLANGEVVPVTKIQAGPCVVSQVKTDENDNCPAIQIGFGNKKEWRMSQPQIGHLKDLQLAEAMRDFSVTAEEAKKVERGDIVTVDTFVIGDKVNLVGTSKGKGFAGVVKRHHFGGGPASHGHKDNLRAPGSIGAGGVQRVFKGLRMAGHMGSDRVTVKNLEIVGIDSNTNELLIKGAVPGGRNALVMISAPGELKVKKATTSAPVEATPVIEETVAVTQA